MSKGGLEDVHVADSAICWIDGEKGELRYRGYSAAELVEHSDFEECAWLLWRGELPTASELSDLRARLGAARALSTEMRFLVQGLAVRTEPMDALRTIVSAACADDASLAGNAPADPALSFDRAIRLTALLPTAVAAYSRARNGQGIVPPDPELDTAANFLWMMSGERPSEEKAAILDDCLILHAEHGFNASTFAARVTASTLTDIYSAVTSAIGTLKGPLHGGANTRVMEMLLEIGDEDRVAGWIEDALAAKTRIMGFGHRVYKVTDPRAIVLKQLSQRLSVLESQPKWFELSRRIEEAIAQRKGLVTNVDFYSASTYHYLGIPPDLFTPIFAISRVAGWTAHVLEQYANNRLIRPRARWIGSEPRAYLPVGQR